MKLSWNYRLLDYLIERTPAVIGLSGGHLRAFLSASFRPNTPCIIAHQADHTTCLLHCIVFSHKLMIDMGNILRLKEALHATETEVDV